MPIVEDDEHRIAEVVGVSSRRADMPVQEATAGHRNGNVETGYLVCMVRSDIQVNAWTTKGVFSTPEAAQQWADNDPRFAGLPIRILAIDVVDKADRAVKAAS